MYTIGVVQGIRGFPRMSDIAKSKEKEAWGMNEQERQKWRRWDRMTEKINDGIKEHHGGMKSKMIDTVTDYNNWLNASVEIRRSLTASVMLICLELCRII